MQKNENTQETDLTVVYMTGYNSAQSTYRALLGEALDALEELVVLMHATYKGEYTPDSFTVQHANTVLVKHGRTNVYDELEVFGLPVVGDPHIPDDYIVVCSKEFASSIWIHTIAIEPITDGGI